MGITLETARFTTTYIGRYAKRPAIAESRIKGYDGKTVLFEYEDKAEKTHRVLALSVEEFLKRLVRHIHDKHFRQIRYAGMYSTRSRKRDLPLARTILGLEQGKKAESLDWRQRRTVQNGCDPLRCPQCGREMTLSKIVYRARDGTLKETVFDNK